MLGALLFAAKMAMAQLPNIDPISLQVMLYAVCLCWRGGALSGYFSLLFGALWALAYWATGGWAAAVSWGIAGIPMDLVHGAGNFRLSRCRMAFDCP